MGKSVFFVVLVAACGGGGGGGSSKGVTIVQQASPNPFKEAGCKVSLGDATVDASITATDDEKKAFAFSLRQNLVLEARGGIVQDGASGSNAFLLRPTLQTLVPRGDSQLQIDVTDASGGQVLEQIRVSARVSSLRDAPGPFARPIARYLKSRFCSR